MKPRKLIPLLLLPAGLLLSGAVTPADNAAEAVQISTSAQSVLMFSRKSLVERKGTFTYKSGQNTYSVSMLPVQMMNDSIQIGLKGDALRIEEVQVIDRIENDFEKEVARAAEELKVLRRRVNSIKNELVAASENLELLRGISVGAKVTADDKVPLPALKTDRWRTFLDRAEGGLDKWTDKKYEIATRLQDAEEDLLVARTNYDRLTGKNERRYKEVVFRVKQLTKAAGKVDLHLTYLVEGSNWYPRYDVHADPLTGKMHLTGYALVKQQTGEDWKNVSLAFSAARIEAGLEAPALTAWYISMQEQRIGRSNMNAAGAAADDYDKAEEMAESEAPAPALEKKSRSFNYYGGKLKKKEARSYRPRAYKPMTSNSPTKDIVNRLNRDYTRQKSDFSSGRYGSARQANEAILEDIMRLKPRHQKNLEGFMREARKNIQMAARLEKNEKLKDNLVEPHSSGRGFDWRFKPATDNHTIMADGSFNKIPLYRIPVDAHFFHEAAPRVDKNAYLSLKGTNKNRRPILAGPASVFAGNEYRGVGFIKTTANNQEFQLYLGVDRDIVIRHKELRHQSTSGLITEMMEFAYKTEIEVKNNKQGTVELTLFDLFPFTRQEDVEVELDSVELNGEKKKHYKNIMEFRLKLKPGSIEKVKLNYTISYPKEKRLRFTRDSYNR